MIKTMHNTAYGFWEGYLINFLRFNIKRFMPEHVKTSKIVVVTKFETVGWCQGRLETTRQSWYPGLFRKNLKRMSVTGVPELRQLL